MLLVSADKWEIQDEKYDQKYVYHYEVKIRMLFMEFDVSDFWLEVLMQFFQKVVIIVYVIVDFNPKFSFS